MVKEGKDFQGTTELPDEALSAAVGGEGNTSYYGGRCTNCGWGCFYPNWGAAREQIEAHEAAYGHVVNRIAYEPHTPILMKNK